MCVCVCVCVFICVFVWGTFIVFLWVIEYFNNYLESFFHNGRIHIIGFKLSSLKSFKGDLNKILTRLKMLPMLYLLAEDWNDKHD